MKAAETRQPSAAVRVAAVCAALLLSPAAARAAAVLDWVSYSSAPAAVDATQSGVPLFSWTFTASGGNCNFTGLYLYAMGDVPPQQMRANLVRDVNNDGQLDGGDLVLSSAVFSGGGGGFPPSAYLFASGETQTAGVPVRYFISADFNGLPQGRRVSFGLFNLYDAFIGGDSFGQIPPLPLHSGESAVYARVYAKPANGVASYPTPTVSPRTGGYDTGVYLGAGQRLQVQVAAADSWDAGPGLTDGDGAAPDGVLGAFNRGALTARVGAGPWFKLGQSTTVTVNSSGLLYLAANDSDGYANNSGYLRLTLGVLPSTTTKVWLGGTIGFENRADLDLNWQGGRPRTGERAFFGASSYDCDWNIPYEELSELTLSTAFAGRRLRLVSPPFGGRNELRVSSRAVIGGGSFTFGEQSSQYYSDPHRLNVEGVLVVKDSATFSLDDGRLAVRDGIETRNGAFFVLTSTGNYTQIESAGGPQGRWYWRVDRATMAVSAPVTLFGVDWVVFKDAHFAAFDGVEFYPNGSSTMPFVTFQAGPAAVSYAFKGWDSFGTTRSPSVDAQVPPGSSISFLNSASQSFGSPHTIGNAAAVTWNPDGGGASGTINGTLSCVGGCGASNYRIIATTDPAGAASPQGGGFTGPPGGYSIPGLVAPATYFLFAFDNGGSGDQPASRGARGGFGHPGYMRSERVFVPSGGNPGGVNLTVKGWGAVSGGVDNQSPQVGQVVVETWDGAPYALSSTRVAQGLAFGSYQFDTHAVEGGVFHSSFVFAYVDLDGDRQHDLFEASGTAVNNSYSPTEGAVASVNPPIVVTGGGVGAGGTLTLSTQAAHAGAIASSGDQPVMRLTLANAGSPSTLTGLRLRWDAPLPPYGAVMRVMEDDGDGSFSHFQDFPRGEVFLSSAGASSGTAVFYSPVPFGPGQTKHLFVTLNTYGAKPSSAAVAIDTSAAFGLAAGVMASQPALYPVVTGALGVRAGVEAFAYASPDGYGGSYTGEYAAAGQSLTILSTGVWRTGPGDPLTGPTGEAGTTGLDTVLPSANRGELIGRLSSCGGCYSPWFRVGAATMPITTSYGGELYLAINDFVNAYYDNSGVVLADFGVSGTTTGVISGTLYYSTPVAGNAYVTAYRWGVSQASVTVSVILAATSYPYLFSGLPPGEYDLGVTHQLSSDFGLSGARVFLAADTTVQLDARMYQGQGSIAGPINYAGVLNYGDFHIVASTSSDFTKEVSFFAETSQPTLSPYSLTGLPAPNTYYVVGFRDGNYNDHPDGPEPLGYHGTPGGSLSTLAAFATPVFVGPGANVTGITVNMADTGGLQGPVAVSTASGGVVTVIAGRGTFGAASFQPESRTVVPVFGSGTTAGQAQYKLGLMRSATDYSVFAFHDANGDEVPGPGEPTFRTAANLAVASGSMSNLPIDLLTVSPPAATTRFSAAAAGSTAVLFTWDGVGGATYYALRRADDSPVVAVNATWYLDAGLTPNTSSQILKVVAGSANGVSAAVALTTAVYSLAAPPAGLAVGNLTAAGADVSWGGGGNAAGTLYEVYRSTIAAGVNARRVFTGPAGTFRDAGVAAGTVYHWDAAAVNGNGIETYSGAPVSGMTLAASGDAFVGTVTYSGAQTGALVVQAATDAGFAAVVSSVALPNLPLQPFFLSLPGAGTYHLRAFVSVTGATYPVAGADRSAPLGSFPSAGSPTAVSFAVAVDTVPPAAPAGLVATPGFGSVTLGWSAPTKNANGSALADLLGYLVARSTGVGAPFTPLQSLASPLSAASFVDATAKPGAPAYYRVAAVDYGRNLSSPTAAQLAVPSAGGSIAGHILSFSAASSGPFRVRLSSSPSPTASALAEVSVPSYTFAGLSDGTYFLRAYRDLDNNGSENAVSEPGGTYGGLNTPFAVPIVNGNAVTLADVAVCDRTQLYPGASVNGTLSAVGCPARDKGPGSFTQLYSIPVGNGAAGSLGLGSQVNLTISSSAFGDIELIVLGPDGSVVARDNRPGGASLSFTASQAGVYLVEPTSFLPGQLGSFTLQMRLDGGFGGAASGTVTYAGARSGTVYAQLFNTTALDQPPVAQSTRATPGAYAFTGLPDGTYYLRGYRDANGNLVRDPDEPAGQFGFSASSPTAVVIAGGFTTPLGGLTIALADPAVGAMKGAVIYDGTQTGSIRVQAGLPSCSQCGDIGTVLASGSTGTANSYFLGSLPSATNYILRAFVDNNGNGRSDVLEPVVSSQSVTITAGATTTVSVILQDPGSGMAGSAVLAGTVAYAGAATGTVFVGFSRDPQFHSLEIVLQLPATGYFQRDGVLGGTTYYMAGFIDVIPNGTPDFQSGEPRGTGGPAGGTGPFLASAPPMIFVPDFGVTGASMTIADPPTGVIRGRVSYAGASAAPLIIVQAGRNTGAGQPMSDFTETVITRQGGVTQYDYELRYLSGAQDYSVWAFVDSNGNGRQDFGEPSNSRYPVSVSSGAGAFPTYGMDLAIFESGGTGTPQSAGRIRGDVSYLGTQSGPVFVRFFTNDSFSGLPFTTVSIPGAAGPGSFPFDKTGLPFNTTFYLDAFRDPSGSGVYNPTFHARGPLQEGGDGLVLTQSRPDRHAYGNITDPGEGGSVNAFTGRLDLPSGARFDGGAFDAAVAVVVDTWTGSPAPTFVAMVITTQNEGLSSMLVRYSSAGVLLSSASLGSGLDGVNAPVVEDGGRVFLNSRVETATEFGFTSTGVVTRLDPGFGARWDVQYAVRDVKAFTYSPVNDRLYAAGPVDYTNDVRVLEIDPQTMNVTSTGTYTMPGAMCNNCGGIGAYGLAVSPDGTKVTVAATSGEKDGGRHDLLFLLRFDRTGGATMPLLAAKDITGLHLPGEGLNLVAGPSGEVFVAGVEKGETTARTYRFDAALEQTASATLPNVVIHFEGGLGNMQVDPADGSVYQAWESTANAGDLLVLRYDNALNLMTTRTFDGWNNSAEDFPFSLTVLDSSRVVVGGGVNNGRSLDSLLASFNMNAAGAVSAAGPAVVVTTVTPVSGSLTYGGSLVSSGTFRTVLLPEGESTPLRFATAPFGASASYFFNNVPYGVYSVRSFLDLDGDLLAEAGEPVAWSKAEGESFLSGSSYAVAALALCDRRTLTAGVPVVDSFSSADCPAPDRAGAYQRLYTFTARRGEPVNLYLEGLGFTDTYLNLYGPDGELMTSADDDGTGGPNARLTGFIIQEDGLYTVAASPFAAGVTGSFRLTLVSGAGSPGSVSGRVDYNGSQGGAIRVGRFASTAFSTSTALEMLTLTSTRVFSFAGVAAGTTYYFGAFVDVNANGAPDAGEDAGVFGPAGTPSPVRVAVGQAVTGVAITISASTASAATASFITGQATLAGAPAAPLILEFWSSAQFTGRPVATRQIPTGAGAFDVAVPGGVSYFVRAFLDLDGDFAPDADEPKGVYAPRGQGAESVFAPAGASVPGVDILLAEPGLTASGVYAGEGTAAISPSTAGAAGATVNVIVTLTVGAHPIGVGGQAGFTVPPGFPFPFGVTAGNTGGATLSPVTVNGPSAFVSVTAGSVGTGQTITLNWGGATLPCAPGAYPFTVASVESGAAAPAPLLSGSPSFSVHQGPPESVSINPPYFSLRTGALSDPLLAETRDRCGNKVAAGAAEVVALRARAYDGVTGTFVTDPSVGLTSAPAVSTAAAIALDFAVGQSSRAFHAVAASTGFKFLELFADLAASPPATYYFGANALPADALTAVRVTTSPAGASAASTATIAQTAAGIPNQIFIDFNLGDAAQSWRVLFATTPYKPGVTPSPVWERWGYGQPTLGEIAWDGRYSPWINGGARVPNGLYYGRVEVGGGGVKDDSLQVTVSVPQFAGRVFDAAVTPNPPLAGATLRVYGPSGSFAATTGADGAFTLPGLGAGTYRVAASRPDYVDAAVDATLDAAAAVTGYAARTAGVAVSSNASGGLDLFLGRAPRLTVVPSLAVGISTAAQDRWGSLQVQPSTGSQLNTVFGPMRLRAGTTYFDDGGQWDPATQRFVTRTQLSFNLPVGTYTVVGELAGFTRSSETVFVGADGAFVALSAFLKKSSIGGQVFRTPNPDGFFASVTAVPLSTAPGASGGFGGVYLQPGTTSALYLVGGLEAGAYLLRANAQGLSAATTGPIVLAANAELAGVDFPAFAAGATLSGNMTIGGTSPNGRAVSLHAWAPGSLNFGSTSVFTTAGTNVVVPYSLKGLDASATYQLYVDVEGGGDAQYDVPGGFPLKVVPQAGYDFTLTPASGVIAGLILLPAGATDFVNVELRGVVVASLRPSEVGHEFVEVSTTLPGFLCGDGAAPSGTGYCAAGVSSATFRVQNLNTQTLDLTFFHRTTGQSARRRVSAVNGSTTTVTADLSASTYSISGSIINQVSVALFNTNAKIVSSAPFSAPVGWPAGLSSSTARVVAVRQELSEYGVAISTVFNEATSRVGFLTASGSFTITNVPGGVYFVRTANLRACATCEILVPSVGRVVRVADAAVSSVTLTLSDGYSVAGTITLDDDISDWAIFDVEVINKRQEVVRSTSVYLGDLGLGVFANAVDYRFNNLPAGESYTLTARDRRASVKYVGRPIKFPDPALSPNGLQSSLTGQDVVMKRAGVIVGRLKDGGTGELIGASNAGLLAPNFRVTATANPWIEGGFVVAAASVAGRPVQADGYFRVGPLLPDVSYDLRLAQTSWDPSFLQGGSQNYAPVTIGGLRLSPGQTLDAGVVALGQGRSITGVVRSTATGAGLGNLKVTARPSFGDEGGVFSQTYTNNAGAYNLWVSTQVSNQFDVTAAPRDGNKASDGVVYGQVTLRNLNLLTATTADFLLTPLPGGVTGQVVVADAASGGVLSYPFGERRGYPAAAINLQPLGVVPRNPLGDIEAATDERGFFSVPGLATGTYTLHATSLGYGVYNATAAVTATSFRLYRGSDTASNDLPGGVLTLTRGATVTGRILKSDGSAPSSTEIKGVAAANFAAGEFVVGSVETDATARTVSAYAISGFRTGVSYDVVLISGEDGEEVSFPTEGAGISFSSAESTTTKSLNLTYKPSRLDCLATAKAVDASRTQFAVAVDCLKPLRAETAADADLDALLSVSTYTSAGAAFTAPNGAGAFQAGTKALSASRRRLTGVYQIATGEARFSVRVRAAAADVDPTTGQNFTIDKVFDFFTGLESATDGRMTNIDGGTLALSPSTQDELLGLDERARLDIRPGTFAEGSNSASDSSVVANPTVTVNVTMTKGRDRQLAQTLFLKTQGFVPAGLMTAESGSAYPAEVWAAMSAYRSQASTSTIGGANPLSSFYSIFLPLGIRHQLKQRADLTLSYNTLTSTGTANDSINVWFYNASLGRYVLENTDRRLDPVNKTVTVSVDHFSTFVVLDSTPTLTSAVSFAGSDIIAASFPNPADCITHSGIARNSTFFAGGTIPDFRGQMIRASLPPGTADDLTVTVYNLAGQKVRTLPQGSVPGGQTYYMPWNCSNDDGRTVSSGVYFGEIKWGRHRKFIKMAIIKGSGL
ncbi:MAG: carboxypeptidase regulatory-like domain-containing protein [Elusimicrobiota bacterium]|nr:carboxypeptidase regulatory-like domain-containing protein [Elusimicrobiota bacterium]